jgi:hypothetical protein
MEEGTIPTEAGGTGPERDHETATITRGEVKQWNTAKRAAKTAISDAIDTVDAFEGTQDLRDQLDAAYWQLANLPEFVV